jgi:DNA mismatch endonuclease (patch repair protein)
MQSNRGVDTGPELALRSALHRRGHRFRINYRPLASVRRTVDIAFPRRRVAVLIDGCFWHGCPQHRTVPKANREYWEPKLSRNIERDRETDRSLNDAGWTVVRVWEHVAVEEAVELVEAGLRERGDSPGRATGA